jgi:hypothetical protein
MMSNRLSDKMHPMRAWNRRTARLQNTIRPFTVDYATSLRSVNRTIAELKANVANPSHKGGGLRRSGRRKDEGRRMKDESEKVATLANN